jgi:hypothetical protein
MTGEDFLILDLYARHRVFKHSVMAVYLSAGLEASADIDFDGGLATGLATTFYLVIWQHNRGNVFMFFCVLSNSSPRFWSFYLYSFFYLIV